MFHHKTALNHAILEGACKVFNQYGGSAMMDFLDINWYTDEDWVWTFENAILKEVERGKDVSVFQGKYEYTISMGSGSYHVEQDDYRIASIPNHSVNEFFLYLSTLFRGDCEV
jgi:hypothetical protein